MVHDIDLIHDGLPHPVDYLILGEDIRFGLGLDTEKRHRQT